ncbi:glutathione S-transferase C-terminal domain-containing protein [Bifidobacterium oedipodis]|uniref:Glutathione S-transferase domain-containing protein n=1 Tax=Bifidobacterium oedipodis TaxID=2675322 RepID=A0A7Y0EM99_9BIFI|nr:glutathione S-transferase C-terminal domain-containing protein [Bifidobacterium sp. DSM 109957]NMM92875.1 Glutathione S-transferase domain-containing protein [Bifidobacterium sp. DSM 109957]
MTTLNLHARTAAPACGVDVFSDDKTPMQYKSRTQDGLFDRQRVYFTKRFGDAPEQVPVIANRYRIIGVPICGWNRRLRILVRLLGLENVIAIESVESQQDSIGWVLKDNSLGKRFGFTHLRDFYAFTDPDFKGKGTSPAVIDEQTGKVVTNNYHTLPADLEIAWKQFHKPGAPDLYPAGLRSAIDLLNQQLFDDVNNNTYKILFANNDDAAQRAYNVFAARLDDYDYRLKSRRYLFGPKLTDSDIRLFQTLEAYETMYRPGIARRLGDNNVLHVWDYPNLWDYARDLYATPGFIDDEEKYEFGFIPDADGKYSRFATGKGEETGPFSGQTTAGTTDYLARWTEPVDRTSLTGDVRYSGPGTAGLEEYWQFGEHHYPAL